jgi:hypothetical protein
MMNGKSIVVGIFFGLAVQLLAEENVVVRAEVPTHADAAIIFAKKSGLFDRYLSQEATLTECITFLNKTGIYFGLMEVVNGTEFKKSDCARVMGQMELVFSGEAEYVSGKVKLPKDIDSWEDFCIMNGVDYAQGYEMIVETLKNVPE